MPEAPQPQQHSRYGPAPGAEKPLRTRAETLRHARDLRRNMIEAEKRLWYLMRRHNLERRLFRRQVPIGDFIVDFAFWPSGC